MRMSSSCLDHYLTMPGVLGTEWFWVTWHTHLLYTSALNSCLTFCKLHDFDIRPTSETLSLFVTYQSTFVNPKLVDSHLSSIVNQMETFFLEVHQNWNCALISYTLKGAKRWHSAPIHYKKPLLLEDLNIVYHDLQSSTDHHNLLFLTQLPVSFYLLLCFTKLCFPDCLTLCNFSKISLWSLVQWLLDAFSFWLPSQKANVTFDGSWLITNSIYWDHA